MLIIKFKEVRTYEITLNEIDDSGNEVVSTPLDLTNANSMEIFAKMTTGDDSLLWSKACDFDTGISGEATVALTTAETGNLDNKQEYRYLGEIKVTYGDGSILKSDIFPIIQKPSLES